MEQQNKIDILNRLQEIKFNVQESSLKANRDLSEINIMAVTKTVDFEIVNFATQNGINLLGENRVQEFLGKYDSYNLKKDNIHFIGHLQTNKVKYIIDKVSMIESVSCIKLAKEIDLQSRQININMPILLQVNISNEETKSGFIKNNIVDSLKVISEFSNIKVQGLMCIPAKEKTEYYFQEMNDLFHEIKELKLHQIDMLYLSMGMTDDYQKAILHNSNIIRLGSAIFGKR